MMLKSASSSAPPVNTSAASLQQIDKTLGIVRNKKKIASDVRYSRQGISINAVDGDRWKC